jgi:hypothetical protein
MCFHILALTPELLLLKGNNLTLPFQTDPSKIKASLQQNWPQTQDAHGMDQDSHRFDHKNNHKITN